jgi:glycosyltransferase family protein
LKALFFSVRLIRGIVFRLQMAYYSIQDLYARVWLKAPTILSVQETIDLIVANRYSISRFGDGEMDIIRGRSIVFQGFDPHLAARLQEVLRSRVPELLIAIPSIFGPLDNMNANAIRFYSRYVPHNRLAWYRATQTDRTYANTFTSRFYIDWVDKSKAPETIAGLRRIWHGRDIVFIEGEESRLGVGNDLFANARSVRRVIAPKKNAFARYQEILDVASTFDRSTLLILALGPTATVLAHDLHLLGFQALDLGHVDIEYEWFRMGVANKVPVKHKYINEVADGDAVDAIVDMTYLNEIVARIA